MRLFPADRFEVETTQTLDEVVEAIASRTKPKRSFRLLSEHMRFKGDVSCDGFIISRMIHYQNSFLPVIEGEFSDGVSGVKVSIKMRLHRFVAAFMYVWFGFIGLFWSFVVVALLAGKAVEWHLLVAPPCMLLFGWALVTGGFWYETVKQKLMLAEIIQGAGGPAE